MIGTGKAQTKGLAQLSSHCMHFVQTQLSHQVNHHLMPQNQLMNKKREGEERSHLKERQKGRLSQPTLKG